jgi:Cu-processing system permease protein
MRTTLAIAAETFLRLRRDRIFLPALLVGVGLLSLSGLASYWGIEEFYKILYDMGAAAYLFTGATVAIFWGNKVVADSKQEGSIEVQLASPVGRSTWLIGKFLGLAMGLFLLAIGFLVAWQLIYAAWTLGWIKPNDLLIFALLTLVWLILGALAICLACVASSGVALFCSAWAFLAGLMSAPIMQALSAETPASTRRAVEIIAGLWNLHYLNLASFGGQSHFVSPSDLLSRVAYGLALCVFFLALACAAFQKKDIVA